MKKQKKPTLPKQKGIKKVSALQKKKLNQEFEMQRRMPTSFGIATASVS